jgi:hypothetical protein
MPRKLAAPEKELRFTRAGQARLFWVAGAVLTAAAIIVVATAAYRPANPSLPHPLWALLPLVLAWLALRLAVRLTRHAYLILTPVGIEIFPFFRPAAHMQLVGWNEIRDAEVSGDLTRLTLHFNTEKTAGIHLSLKPIPADRLPLLVQALAGRVGKPAPTAGN